MAATLRPEAERQAELCLREYWSNRTLPVDPILVARRLGIDVRLADLPDDVSGAIIKQAGAAPIILVDIEDHQNRQRFTVAHEIGHYFRRAGDEKFEYIDLRGQLASQGTDSEEQFANAFAAALLMPAEFVRQHAEKRGIVAGGTTIDAINLDALAKTFGVSPEAMRWRLVNLGILRDESAARG